MKKHKQKYSNPLKFSLFLTFLVFIWSGINPYDYFTWFLEVLPAVLVFIVLAVTFKKFRFSDFTYIFICFHAMILMVGGHSTYAEMPLFNWVRDVFGLDRNYYDRFGHFAQGFVPALVANEIIIRKKLIAEKKWRYFMIVFLILGFSAFYEFFEWWVAILIRETAEAFLGTQGDVWDTQWDMFMCFLGSLSAVVFLFKTQERKINKI